VATFNGIRVAVLEARRSTELAELVRRLGGEPCAVPAVREVAHLERVPAFLDALQARRVEIAIFLTGVGVARLLEEARRLGRIDATLSALCTMTTVCRGPKPSAVLRQHGVPVTIRAAPPHTTTEVLDALAAVSLAGRATALLHYGERSERLADALRARGALVEEVCLYDWQLPEETDSLAALGREIVRGDIQAVMFTSQIQCRHLFAVAARAGFAEALADALKSRVVVAAIGPVCADALQHYGVTPHVLPSQARMGYLVTELAEYLETHHQTRR
jgi:uroporphyrinogen-III synthase